GATVRGRRATRAVAEATPLGQNSAARTGGAGATTQAAMPQAFHTDVAPSSEDLVVRMWAAPPVTARAARVAEARTAPRHWPPPPRLALDLGGVTFCDSSGLGALLDIRRLADEAGVPMVLREVPAQVARLLDLTDVDAWLSRE